jgi:superfamily II DNA or RNA helicase
VELVAQSPEISLTTTKAGELKLALRPALDYREPGIVVKMESENRVTITTVRQSHVDLHRVLQMGSSFPVEAKERLVASLGKLSSEVSIESDSVGFETIARSVPAQDLPELRLMPDGEGGIMVSLSVQPIVEVGEHFAPGSGKPVVFARTQENEHLQTERNLKVEAERASAVALACAVLQGGREETRNAWTWHLAEPDDCLELLLDLNELNADTVKVTWPEGESLRPPKAVSASQFRGSVKGAGQWFEADGELQVDDDLVLTMRQLMELLELSNAGSRFIEISKGRFIALTRQFRRQLDDLRALSTEGKGGVRKLSPLAAHALADLEETTSLKTGTGWKSQLKKIRDAEDFQPKVPKTLRADLRGYQTDGYDWLARLAEWGAGACLADDMGLGKTVQALALLLHRAKGGPALVIAPTSVAANWIDEVARFAPTLEIVLYTGPDRKDRLEEIGSHSLVITTYGILQRGDDELTAVKWHTVVLDEAQAIKNRATKRSKAAMKLQAPFRIATTGTPVENRLDELHNLFTFLNPGLLGSAERFRTQFADPIERNKDAAARDRLRRVIKPFILRRMKGDVLKDLPPKTEVTLHVELDEQESAFYEALRQKAVSDLESAKQAPEESAVRILAEITRLRRACCHPKLVQPKGAPESSKQRVFIETLTEILDGGHQVLVFSQFVDHLKIARQSLDDLGIEYQYLDGSTPARKRKVAIDAFQSGEGNVFLISLKAGGSGLNLTAADYVIHLDPWWNPAVEDQASDRAHRIGQQRPVTVYRLVTKGTIEEKIVALHHEKRDLASAMLEGTDAAGRLTSEQMLALIRDAGA